MPVRKFISETWKVHRPGGLKSQIGEKKKQVAKLRGDREAAIRIQSGGAVGGMSMRSASYIAEHGLPDTTGAVKRKKR
jgi:hypothetical protein